MGKGKKRGGGGGRGKQNKGGGGHNKKQKDDSPVVAKKKVAANAFPVPGLMNLGNTCFFNSVMQSIGQSKYLWQRLDALVASPRYNLLLTAEEHQLRVTVSGEPGLLTKTLHSFMGEMATQSGRSLNPRPLFSQICDKASRFRGFQQQDSQELLRYLLDSLKVEEIHRIKRAILVAFNISSKLTGKQNAINKLTERDRELIKAFGNRAHHEPTYVDEVFGGSLVSTVTCRECHNCTTIHESYLDLSLPMPKDKTAQHLPGGKQHQVRNRREKGRRNTPTKAEEGRKEEEEGEIDNPKAAAASKHQLKKARKKDRKGKPVRRHLHELGHLLERKDGTVDLEVDDCVENQEEKGEMKIEEKGEMVDQKECRNLGGKNESEDVSNLVQGNDCSCTNVGVGEAGTVCKEGVEGEKERTSLEADDLARTVEEEAKLNEDYSETATVTQNLIELTCSSDKVTASISTNPGEAPQFSQNSIDDKTADMLDSSPLPDSTEVLPMVNQPSAEEAGDATLPGQPVETTPSLIETCSPLTSVVCPEDSIEGCLKKFCSPELLTGSNRFLCSSCTERKVAEKASPEQEEIDYETATELVGSQAVATESTGAGLNNGTRQEPEVSDDPRNAVEDLQERVQSVKLSCDRGEECEGVGDAQLSIALDEEEGMESGKSSMYISTSERVEGARKEEEEEEEEEEEGEEREESETTQHEMGVEVDEKNEQRTGDDEKMENDSENRSVDDGEEESRLLAGSQEESAKESDDAGDDLLDSNSEASPQKTTTSSSTEMVFCDATKQLLIENVPPVLTLHLKRFLQEGRRLRKNGRHIAFPALLNMAPYCVTDCKSLCDSCGQLLYSLYGVVEHAGGMQGGHYTAYIRVRKMDNHTPHTTVGGARDRSNHAKEVDEQKGCVATSGVCTQATTTDGQKETTAAGGDHTVVNHMLRNGDHTAHQSDHATSTASQHTIGDQVITTNSSVISHTTISNQTDTTGYQTITTTNQNDTTADQTAIVPTKTGATPPHTPSNSGKNSNQRNLEFDLSSTSGQWYHISDTHVRTATQSEVERSQAYILFYERLPFKNS